MLLRHFIFLFIMQTYSAEAEKFNLDSQTDFATESIKPSYFNEEVQLEKYQTLIIKDLVINSEQEITNSDEQKKEEGLLNKLSSKTKGLFD